MPTARTFPEDKQINDVDDLIRSFERLGYVTDRALATAVYLVIKLGKPLLIEGHAGLGKTEVAQDRPDVRSDWWRAEVGQRAS